MGWQDELRELDAMLAAGTVSADEYRRKRDELLSRASGSVAPVKPSPGQQAANRPVAQGPQGPGQPALGQPALGHPAPGPHTPGPHTPGPHTPGPQTAGPPTPAPGMPRHQAQSQEPPSPAARTQQPARPGPPQQTAPPTGPQPVAHQHSGPQQPGPQQPGPQQPGPPQTGSQAGPQQPGRTDSGPFPAPFRWDSPAGRPESGESTQHITAPPQSDTEKDPSRSGEFSAEKTQIVSGLGDGGERTQAVGSQAGNQPGEATQIVPSSQTGSDGWAAQRPEPGPSPWASADKAAGYGGYDSGPGQFPGGGPWRPDSDPVLAPDPSWLKQGPEIYKDKSGKRGRTIGIVVAAVLVVGLVAAGVGYFLTRDNSTAEQPPPPQPTTSTTAPPTTTTRSLPNPPPAKPAPASNEAALIDPPGTVRDGGGAFDLARLETNKLLQPNVIEALKAAGMTEGLLKTTVEQDKIVGLYALTVADEAGAKAVAEAYGTEQRTGGLPANAELSYKGVPVYSTGEKANTSVYRSVYVLYNRVIILETFGPGAKAVQDTFTTLLVQQLELAPPSSRV